MIDVATYTVVVRETQQWTQIHDSRLRIRNDELLLCSTLKASNSQELQGNKIQSEHIERDLNVVYQTSQHTNLRNVSS